VKVVVQEPIKPSTFLRDDFWPSMCIEAIVEDQYTYNGRIMKEFREDDAFVGQLRDCPLQSFRVSQDL